MELSSGLLQRALRRAAAIADGPAPAAISMPLIAWSDRHYVEPEARLLPFLIDRDDAAIDVGAANGSYAYAMARLARECHAFEPNPESAALLRRRVPTVQVHAVALSSRKGAAVLRVPSANGVAYRGWGSMHADNRLAEFSPHALQEIEVETATLDSFRLAGVGMIKIDVEGHELEVLRGAMATIGKDQPAILVEAEDRHRPGALESICALLGPLGYEAWHFRGGRLHTVDTPDNAGQSGGEARPRNFFFLCRQREDRRAQLSKFLAAR